MLSLEIKDSAHGERWDPEERCLDNLLKTVLSMSVINYTIGSHTDLDTHLCKANVQFSSCWMLFWIQYFKKKIAGPWIIILSFFPSNTSVSELHIHDSFWLCRLGVNEILWKATVKSFSLWLLNCLDLYLWPFLPWPIFLPLLPSQVSNLVIKSTSYKS